MKNASLVLLVLTIGLHFFDGRVFANAGMVSSEERPADLGESSKDTEVENSVTYITDAFIIAAASGNIEEIKRFIDEEGKSVNYEETALGLTPLISAVASGSDNTACVEFLLKQPGIDVNKAMKDGLTPLHCAVLQNDIKILKLLLEIPEIDVTVVYEDGMTAELIAQENGYTEVLQLLQDFKGTTKKS